MAKLHAQVIRKYTVEFDFPTKKAAKEAVARLALRQGLLEEAKNVKLGRLPQPPSHAGANGMLSEASHDSRAPSSQHVRAIPRGFPDFHSDEDDEQMEMSSRVHRHEAAAVPYDTVYNDRVSGVTLASAPTHEGFTLPPPPPYAATPALNRSNRSGVDNVAQRGGSETNHRINPLIAQQMYATQADIGRIPASNNTSADRGLAPHATSAAGGRNLQSISERSVPISTNQAAADQPLLQYLQKRAAKLLGTAWSDHLIFQLSYDSSSGCYGGCLTFRPHNGPDIQYSIPFRASSMRMAQELAATKAIDGGILNVLEREFGDGAIAQAANPALLHPGEADLETLPDASRAAHDEELPSESEKPTTATAAADLKDPFSQPVGYLHQICQVLIGTEAEHRPKYDILRKEGNGASMRLFLNCIDGKASYLPMMSSRHF